MIRIRIIVAVIILVCTLSSCAENPVITENPSEKEEVIANKANGFKGIWYMDQPSNDEYVYKYSGGMGTYCAKHRPFAIYSEEANKTFFCFGGTDDENSTLFHNVSYFDHATGEVANPTIILDKKTIDAHDNPVISMDNYGYIYIFSTSHGTSRRSYISKSKKPYDISEFRLLNPTEKVDGKDVPFNNFSYFQVWFEKGKGFIALFTKYNNKGHRVIGYNTSVDGEKWGEWKVIAHMDLGHYQVSGEQNGKVAVAFNYHPNGKGLNYRTNLYYLETLDWGETWQTAKGESVELPLTEYQSPALIYDYKKEGLNCYMKDINFDKDGNPIIMIVSSKGYQSGPLNNPRTWEVFTFNNKWQKNTVTISDNNYDSGSIYVENGGAWKVVGPTITGPQAYNPGGEILMWNSSNQGASWQLEKQLTWNSTMNHNYLRRPVNVHPDFYGIWADGHGRQPSESAIYFCNKNGDVFKLPREMTGAKIKVIP